MINKTKQTLDQRLIRTVADMQRELIALKQRQLLGGDNLVIGNSNVSSTFVVVPANTTQWFRVSVQPADNQVHLWNFRWSFYVDGGGPYNFANAYPGGSALSGGQLKMRPYYISDYTTSNDSTGLRVDYVAVENYDTAPHTISVQTIYYTVSTPISS